MRNIFVYLIACKSESSLYIKIGKTVNLRQRISNIQTGCPHEITDAFIIESIYEEEINGLERLLHRLLPSRIRGEWYKGGDEFFEGLNSVLIRINSADFTYEEISRLPDMNTCPELEIMLHTHNFKFKRISFPVKSSDSILYEAESVYPEDIVRQLLCESPNSSLKLDVPK